MLQRWRGREHSYLADAKQYSTKLRMYRLLPALPTTTRSHFSHSAVLFKHKETESLDEPWVITGRVSLKLCGSPDGRVRREEV
ncbi:hypothetical protein EMCRGX_G029539 [Ephydatia muelleri]